MWIKVCGITRLEDAEAAVAAGADAIGFVFAESPRRVTPQMARSITRGLRAPVERIGVFVDASVEEVSQAYETAGLTGVQMHGEKFAPGSAAGPGQGDFRISVNDAAARPRLIWALRYQGDPNRFRTTLEGLQASRNSAGGCVDAVLVDTFVAGKNGGSGIAFDWGAARDGFRRAASHLRLIAAGGLSPENVGEAIRVLEPWGVDVSSGVEASPGKKDPQRIREFIRAARQAAAERSRQ